MKKKLVAMVTALCCMAVSVPAIPVNAEGETGSAFAILGSTGDSYAVMRLPSRSIKDKDGNIFYECDSYIVSEEDMRNNGFLEYSAGDIVLFQGGTWCTTELAGCCNYANFYGGTAKKLESVLDNEPVSMTITSFNPYQEEWSDSTNMVGLSDGEKNYIFYRDWFKNSEDVPFGFDWKTVEVGDVIQFYTYNGFPVIAEKVTGHDDTPTIAPPSPIDDNQVYSGTCGENASWTLQNGTLTISGTGDMKDWTTDYLYLSLALHDEDGNYIAPMTLCAPWYQYREKIREIVIENGITNIGNCAFSECYNVESISIPDSVTKIGESIFYSISGMKCDKLTSVNIPASVTSIGGCAFWGTGLTSIDIPDSVTKIGSFAFKDCANLTSAVLPSGLEVIEMGLFNNCTKLESISIPESVSEIQKDALQGTKWLTLQKAENPLVIVNHLVLDGTNCKGDVIIPEGIDRIENYAFHENKNSFTVKLPDTIKVIAEGAFMYSGLTNINFPEGLTTIEMSAFSCTKLSDVVLPESLTSMDIAVFMGCSNLVSVHFPSSMKTLPNQTFYACTFKNDFTVQESIETIGEGAFNEITTENSIVFLNPNCEFYHNKYTISTIFSRNMSVSGFEGSTAQEYAEKYGKKFVSLGDATELPKGDIDNSGKVSIVDVLITNQYLLGVHKLCYRQKQAADVNGDKLVNDADTLHLLKSLVNLTEIVQ